MNKKAKLLEAAKNQPGGLSFVEFRTLLRQCNWVHDHTRGSHEIWYSPSGLRLSIQKGASGKAKKYQVEQFLSFTGKEIGDECE